MELVLLFILMSLYTLIKGVDGSTLRCGIFGGFSHYLSENEVDNIRTLGAISYPRGVDSVGLAICHRKTNKSSSLEYFMDKVVSDPWGFLYHPETTKLLRKTNNLRAMIGHVRSATIGEVTRDNAHPYQCGPIIGVHNGTIQSLRTPGTTDSHVLYKRIAELGVKQALSSFTEGAYALAWFDKNLDTINFVRNEQRPLWIMSNKANSTWYFASERIFLNYIDARETVTYDEPFLIEPGIIYTYKLGSQFTLTKEPLKVTTESPFKRDLPDVNYDEYIETRAKEEAKPIIVLPDQSKKTPTEQEVVRSMSVLNNTKDTRSFSFSIARHKLERPGKPPFVIPDIILSSTKESLDVATSLFPNVLKEGSTDIFPRSCNVNRQYKKLFYRDFNGLLVDPFEILTILEDGCLMTKRKAPIYERLFWLNDMEFVTYDEKDDDYVKEYLTMCGNKRLVEGQLVYASPSSYRAFSRGVN